MTVVEAKKPKDFEIIPAKWIDLKLQHHLGLYSDRLMRWCNTDPPNFGDWVGPEIFRRRRGVMPKLAPVYMRPNRATVHLTAGSILGSCSVADVAVVWGTGVMNQNTTFSAPREICAVRGPLTAARCRDLGYACPDIYGDPGIVLPNFFPVTSVSRFQLGVIPHFVDQELAAHVIERTPEVRMIDVTQSVEEVISEIQACDLLVSSSLHGVIVSHAFGRRCAWVNFGDTLAGDGTKFWDYFSSAGLLEQPNPLRVDRDTSIKELIALSQNSALPDLSVMADHLLDACPF